MDLDPMVYRTFRDLLKALNSVVRDIRLSKVCGKSIDLVWKLATQCFSHGAGILRMIFLGDEQEETGPPMVISRQVIVEPKDLGTAVNQGGCVTQTFKPPIEDRTNAFPVESSAEF
jgi:hypothetical protein